MGNSTDDEIRLPLFYAKVKTMSPQDTQMLQMQIGNLDSRLTAMGARMDRYEGDMRTTMAAITDKLDLIQVTLALRNGERNGLASVFKWVLAIAGTSAAWFGALHFRS
jgi:hypothetical protein